MKRLLLVATFSCAAAWAASALAQLPAGDLRLWLKADSLNLAEGAQVKQWVDSSPFGTIFSPRTTSNPNGPLGGFPIEEYPHLQTATVNGVSFPTVQFVHNGDLFQTGDPAVDESGSTDRLFQVNNRDPASDPLAIGDGTSFTSFTVFKPNLTKPGTGGFQTVWGLRGNSASLYQLGISGGNPNDTGRLDYVTYDAVTGYIANEGPVGVPQPAGKWEITEMSIAEQGAHDALSFASNSTENPASPLADLPVSHGGLIDSRNAAINEDPPGMLEPFALGAHAQDCCGEGEIFDGNIAEVIIYARTLSAQEHAQVVSYLTTKYLGNVPEPTSVVLMLLGLVGVGFLCRR